MDLPDRKLHRLKNYDYSQNGYYHITICTKNRQNLLGIVGKASDGSPHIIPTPIGQMVVDCLLRMPEIEHNLKIDCFGLMPDHIHAVILINDAYTDEHRPANDAERRGRPSLQELIRGFKSTTTRLYKKNISEDRKNTLWQSSFYDEIIRNEVSLQLI